MNTWGALINHQSSSAWYYQNDDINDIPYQHGVIHCEEGCANENDVDAMVVTLDNNKLRLNAGDHPESGYIDVYLGSGYYQVRW